MADPHDTPAMRQFHRFKKQHPECVLFFRMGDFYECFYDDAKLASRVLGVTLTQRTEGVPMAGVPYHSVEGYLRRMVAAGHRVAVCDQVEEASQAKGVVRREVTRLVTPGTLTDESMLDDAAENYLAAVQILDDDRAAIACAELSTGAMEVADGTLRQMTDELARLSPRELLYVETADHRPPPRIATIGQMLGCSLTARPAWQFRVTEATEALLRQFQVTTLTGFGLAGDDPAIGPAGAVVAYLLETQQAQGERLAHLSPPRRRRQEDHLVIDQVSLRSLEVERTLRSGEVSGSLLGVLQDCRTAMGKRMLRQWLCYPLTDIAAIRVRQDAVAALVNEPDLAEDLADALVGVQDVPRISGRIAVGRPTPRDLVALGQSLGNIREMLDLLSDRPEFAGHRQRVEAVVEALEELGTTLAAACVEAAPAHLRDGGLIRDGYDAQLDEYRVLQRDAGQFLAEYQKRLTDETAIPSLKLGYNRVFGYYIEVTHAHTGKVPPEFTRKQTLKNAERYITPQLKEFEDKVLSAGQKAVAREQALFTRLCEAAEKQLDALNAYAEVVAELDVLGCFARRAVRCRYTRPEVVEEPVLEIREGRHPVLDDLLEDRFVPNDVHLGATAAPGVDGPDGRRPECSSATLALITGPNMAGKSTYIRQTALLTLLAHAGAFIPAAEARIGLTDRIFTRIGASDEIHLGQSTFMVEMTETANICHHATDRSLVILDEIGRGTSTLDGLALAWAIAEHLAGCGCRTLFATHYHELTDLAEQRKNVANLNVTVREWADEVVFLHRITPGSADKSYGIHVAQIAGLPVDVVGRARDLMNRLEVHTGTHAMAGANGSEDGARGNSNDGQLGLFTEYVEHPAVAALRRADLNRVSPIEAFDLLRQLKADLDQD